ncbi:uncharacterized protein ARMOST_13153 [Armillaria ostoyae]|uniref:Uncharacterized protein n=1 Tax=Armillaria ostoyae TaxID=47428 RepID=A0A284RLY3_ARMOS|nr:uncharacterized protein ARMOST_13153 [Armillaria ostoyae]
MDFLPSPEQNACYVHLEYAVCWRREPLRYKTPTACQPRFTETGLVRHCNLSSAKAQVLRKGKGPRAMHFSPGPFSDTVLASQIPDRRGKFHPQPKEAKLRAPHPLSGIHYRGPSMRFRLQPSEEVSPAAKSGDEQWGWEDIECQQPKDALPGFSIRRDFTKPNKPWNLVLQENILCRSKVDNSLHFLRYPSASQWSGGTQEYARSEPQKRHSILSVLSDWGSAPPLQICSRNLARGKPKKYAPVLWLAHIKEFWSTIKK